MKHYQNNSISFDYDDSLLLEIVATMEQIISEPCRTELRLCAENYVKVSNIKGLDNMLADDMVQACAVEIVNDLLMQL